jgi:hypothetical protein
MGLLDRVREAAAETMERGTELARQQQAKLELRRLQGRLDDAFAAYGRMAYAQHGQTGSIGLENEAQAIREAQFAVEAKQTEIDAYGTAPVDDPTEETVPPPTAPPSSTTTYDSTTGGTGTSAPPTT